MRWMVLLVVLLGTGWSYAAADEVPDPSCVRTSLDDTERILLIPDNDGGNPSPLGTFTVTVLNVDCIPIQYAIVDLLIGGVADGRVKLCGDAETTVITGPDGVATFNVSGGGCFKDQYALVIRANGVTIREFASVMSPDYAGHDDEGLPNRWSLSITAADFASFALAFSGGTGGATCHDYDNNGTTGASDLSVFGQVWAGGTRFCSP